MTREYLLKGSFFIALIVFLLGAIFKIMRIGDGATMLIIGFVSGLIFMILAIYEVNTSSHIERMEKIMWTVGFLFMCIITGIVYLLAGRKRVVRQLAQ